MTVTRHIHAILTGMLAAVLYGCNLLLAGHGLHDECGQAVNGGDFLAHRPLIANSGRQG
jgi:hypothetical protein